MVICWIGLAVNWDQELLDPYQSNLDFFAGPYDQSILTCLKKYTGENKGQVKVENLNMYL